MADYQEKHKVHICSAVVHARPSMAAAVEAGLAAFPGVQVHGGVEQGRLVVTLEGEGDDALADAMSRFNQVDGVLNTVMVYHYCGDETETEEVEL